jgi:soluble lytic murein transglycosylase-like protein
LFQGIRRLVITFSLASAVCFLPFIPAEAKTPRSDSVSEEAVKRAEEYKASLQELAIQYDKELKRLTEQSAALKQLYENGLISRREFEQRNQALADARSKSDEIQKQIASADEMVQKASQAPAQISSAPYNRATFNAVSWTTGNKKVDNLINYYGGLYGVDPYLIFCVMCQESGFRFTVTSSKGARGLMQLMPETAARFGVSDPFDPEQSIMGGTRYLKFLLDKFDGNLELTLAGYNAGEGTVMKYGNRIPPYPETQVYVRNISALYLNKQS